MAEDNKILLEKMNLILAQYAHDAWSGWMQYLFTKGRLNKSGSFTIKKDSVDRWQRQMNTSFYDLPQEEKESDFAEASTILDLQRVLLQVPLDKETKDE